MENWVEERLDRAIAAVDWCSLFQIIQPYLLKWMVPGSREIVDGSCLKMLG